MANHKSGEFDNCVAQAEDAILQQLKLQELQSTNVGIFKMQSSLNTYPTKLPLCPDLISREHMRYPRYFIYLHIHYIILSLSLPPDSKHHEGRVYRLFLVFNNFVYFSEGGRESKE